MYNNACLCFSLQIKKHDGLKGYLTTISTPIAGALNWSQWYMRNRKVRKNVDLIASEGLQFIREIKISTASSSSICFSHKM